MSLKNEFVPYEQALALKELGFDEPCLGLFKFDNLSLEYPYLTNTGLINSNLEKYCSAPLYQQAFRWFRDKYNFVSEINVYSTSDGYSFSFKILCKKYTPYIEVNNAWLLYEEAELECLKKLIEIVRNAK